MRTFRYRRCLVPALIVLCACGQIHAGDADFPTRRLSDLSLEQLSELPVDSASSIASQISDAPSAVSIVSGDEIRAFGYHTLADVLQSMRGLYVTNDYAYSFLGGRGFGRPGDFTGRIMLMIDGRVANNNIYNSANLEYAGLVDPSLVERVEYVSGPGSIIYGNTALFGVINVVTRKGHDINGVQVIGELASHHAREGKINYGKRLDNGAEILLSASGFGSDGRDYSFAGPYAFHSKGMDGQHSRRLFGKIEWEDWYGEIAYSYRYKDIPTAPYGSDVGAPYHYEDSYLEGNLKRDFDISPDLKLALNSYFGRFEYRGLEAFSGTPWRERSVGAWWGLNAQAGQILSATQRILYGVDYRLDFRQDIDTPVSRSHRDESTLSFYVEDQIDLGDRLKWNIGARYDHNSETSGKLTPRLALIYTPTDDTTLKLSASRALRRANPFEKYYTDNQYLLTNAKLRPEEIRALELVLEHHVDRDTKWLGSVYRYRTDKYISSQVVDPVAGSSQFQNTPGGTSTGIELEFEKHWPGGSWLRTSAAYQNARDAAGDWLVNSPRVIGKVNYLIPLRGWTLASELQLYGHRLTEQQTRASGYGLANLTLSTDRLIPSLNVAFGVRNVFDRHYQDVAPAANTWQEFLPQDGRSFWLRLTYDFK